MFLLVLFSALSGAVRLPSIVNSVASLLTSTPQDASNSRQLATAQSTWYIVRFAERPSIHLLASRGISLTPSSYVSPKCYFLHLTGAQASFLVKQNLATVGEIQNKLMNFEIPFNKADFLHVRTAPSFVPSALDGLFIQRTPSHFTVVSSNLEETARQLATHPDVFTVWPGKVPKLHNHLASGFSQFNTRTLNANFSFDRYFEAQGITGAGTVVTVWDTYLDTNSTYFYDKDHPVRNGTVNTEHRKVVYHWWHAEKQLEWGDHGTHTSGTVAGVATDSNSEAAEYNGVAPGARLAFRGWPIADEEFDNYAIELAEIMDRVNSTITSNSWGGDEILPELILSSDEVTFHHPQKLFVFSAGNSGTSGYLSVGSPAQAKNILAVGAVSQLQVTNAPPNVRYFLTTLTSGCTVLADVLPGTPNVIFPPDNERMAFHFLYNTLNFTGNLGDQVVYVTSLADIKLLMQKTESTRPFAAITNTTFTVSTTFPVIQPDDPTGQFWNFAYEHNNETIGIQIYREFRPNSTKLPDLAYFSSVGPALNGLIKPEIVGPGAGIASAWSVIDATPNHDLNPFKAMIAQGTSMSCPNIAGAAALVTEYIRKNYNLNPTSSLVKAVLIGSAEPGRIENHPEPDQEFGFGVLNLGGHLPFANSSFNLLVADNVSIDNGTHLVATLNVTSSETDFRVTISFLDPPTALDGFVGLYYDLTLIVESPKGEFLRGNQHPDQGEEHFSTTQRVIVFPGEVAVGIWKIHVIADLPDLADNISFAAAVKGVLNTHNLDFELRTDCIDCGDGKCGPTGLCQCPEGKLGQSCQFAVTEIVVNSVKNISIVSSGNAYLKLVRPGSHPGNVTLNIAITDVRSLELYPLIHVYVIHGGVPRALPRDYDSPDWGRYNLTYEFVHVESDTEGDSVLIHNPLHWNTTYTIWTEFTAFPQTPTHEQPSEVPNSHHLSTGSIVGIVLGCGALVIVVVVVSLVCVRKRNCGRNADTGHHLI
jgi:subtilisin family serine protease